MSLREHKQGSPLDAFLPLHVDGVPPGLAGDAALAETHRTPNLPDPATRNPFFAPQASWLMQASASSAIEFLHDMHNCGTQIGRASCRERV